ncbi:VrrA/YqfQ family protein [Sporosarcina sp. CAU 1771]
MRYQSFYPFVGNQSTPPPIRQSGFGMPLAPGQPFPQGSPFPGGEMNQSPYANMQGNPPAQNTSKLESYMQTANNFLNTAQQFAPVVQQFAPMVQNLPAMWKLYKGFQSMPDANPPGGNPTFSPSQPTVQNTPTGPPAPRIFQPRGF